jgi:hypothetical protein
MDERPEGQGEAAVQDTVWGCARCSTGGIRSRRQRDPRRQKWGWSTPSLVSS